MHTRSSILALAAAACLATPALAQEAAAPDAGPSVTEPAPPEALQDMAAPAAEPEQADRAVYDPWEGVNRASFELNEGLDHVLLEPVARGYRSVTTRPIRSGVANFLDNLRGPVIFVNDVLQGEPRRAGVTAGRFVLNTTVGVFGLFDVAQHAGLEEHDEDFGQTLAVWGVGPGPYTYLPFLGPSTVRDGFGRIVDLAFNPLTWAEFEGDDAFAATTVVVGGVSDREALLEVVDDVRATSIDPYSTIRNTFMLTRESAIRNGLQDVQDLPDFNESFEPLPETLLDGAPPAEEPAAPDAVGAGEQGIPQ